nr:molybdenum cofactor guanylyltransferase [Brevundimonas sp.]
MRFGTAILAGGRGVRIGGAKPSRMLGGMSLLERATERALFWGAPTAIVVRTGDQVVKGARLLNDHPNIPGPLAGLRAAIIWAAELDLQAVLTIPCDMPFLPADLPWRLGGSLTEGFDVATAISDGRRHPICSLWRPGVLGAIDAMVSRSKYSLHGVADSVGAAEVCWPVNGIDPFFNINSQADMYRAARIIAMAEKY